MYFECHEAHPYRNIIEYLNITEAASFIEDYLNLVETVEFNDTMLVTSNKIVLHYTDLKNIRKTLSSSDFLHLVIHRYINALQILIMKNKVESTEVFLRLGEFRERIIHHFSLFNSEHLNNISYWFKTNALTLDDFHYRDSLIMEIELSRQSEPERNSSIRRICSSCFTDIEGRKKLHGKRDDVSNATPATPDNHDYIESLVIPKIKPLSDLSDFVVEVYEADQGDQVYLNALNFNNYMKDLLSTQLEHHINKIGKDGHINKNKVYSSYGVTPNLKGSTNKTSEETHSYDIDLKSVEKKLHIDQIIIISFLMYLRYFLSDDVAKFNKPRLIHQIISSPDSRYTVPPDLIKSLQDLIQSYSIETALSNDENGETDYNLVKLIQVYLNYKFSISTLNDYNNFLILLKEIKDNVQTIVTEGSDYNSLLNMDGLLNNITDGYNKWLSQVKLSDTNVEYEEKSDLVFNRILIKNNQIYHLQDTSFIKERFINLKHSE